MAGFSKEMQGALREDAAKLSAMTGEEHTVEFFSTEDDLAATYPPGITSADHIAHDMRLGRFPEQSTIAQFLEEIATESDASILHRVMAEPTMEATERASKDATRIRNAIQAVRTPVDGQPAAERKVILGEKIDAANVEIGRLSSMLETAAKRSPLELAAPEMLAALKAAAPFMRSGDGGTRGGIIEMNRLAGILEAAIAKAEGRS